MLLRSSRGTGYTNNREYDRENERRKRRHIAMGDKPLLSADIRSSIILDKMGSFLKDGQHPPGQDYSPDETSLEDERIFEMLQDLTQIPAMLSPLNPISNSRDVSNNGHAPKEENPLQKPENDKNTADLVTGRKMLRSSTKGIATTTPILAPRSRSRKLSDTSVQIAKESTSEKKEPEPSVDNGDLESVGSNEAISKASMSRRSKDNMKETVDDGQEYLRRNAGSLSDKRRASVAAEQRMKKSNVLRNSSSTNEKTEGDHEAEDGEDGEIVEPTAKSKVKPRADKERLEKEKAEKEKLQKEKEEKERLDKERAEKERLEKEKRERERIQKEKEEKEKAEKIRIQKEKEDKERIQKEKEEKERAEKAEKERIQKEKSEKERLDTEKEAPNSDIEPANENDYANSTPARNTRLRKSEQGLLLKMMKKKEPVSQAHDISTESPKRETAEESAENSSSIEHYNVAELETNIRVLQDRAKEKKRTADDKESKRKSAKEKNVPYAERATIASLYLNAGFDYIESTMLMEKLFHEKKKKNGNEHSSNFNPIVWYRLTATFFNTIAGICKDCLKLDKFGCLSYWCAAVSSAKAFNLARLSLNKTRTEILNDLKGCSKQEKGKKEVVPTSWEKIETEKLHVMPNKYYSLLEETGDIFHAYDAYDRAQTLSLSSTPLSKHNHLQISALEALSAAKSELVRLMQ